MNLETMSPNPDWEADHEGAIETFASHAEDLTIRVWGGDWCGDCQAVLPDFSAALDAAGVPEGHIGEYALNQEKEGKLVDEYDIEYIPTIVVERDGNEIVRFVESEPEPPIVFLADRLEEDMVHSD